MTAHLDLALQLLPLSEPDPVPTSIYISSSLAWWKAKELLRDINANAPLIEEWPLHDINADTKKPIHPWALASGAMILLECSDCGHRFPVEKATYPTKGAMYEAICLNCYDGAPDSGPQRRGFGDTPEEAAQDWSEWE